VAYLHPIHTPRGVAVLGGASPVTGSLLAWLEPSRQGGVNGQPVASLTNFAGGTAWSAPSEGARATYETGGAGGLPVLTFDGDNAYTMPSFGDLTSLTLTLLVRLDAYDGTTYNNRCLASWADAAATAGDAGGGALLIGHDAAGLQLYSPSATNDLDISAATDAEEWRLITVRASTTAGTLYYDGASVGTDTAAITIAADRGYLGAYDLGGSLDLGGHFKLAAALLYASDATANRTAAEAYLTSRFSL
jgi:hypothetical protein